MILADEQTHLRLTLARAATMADRGSITSGEMMLEMGLQRMARLEAKQELGAEEMTREWGLALTLYRKRYHRENKPGRAAPAPLASASE